MKEIKPTGHCSGCPNCGRGVCQINHPTKNFTRKNKHGVFPIRRLYHCEKDTRSYGEVDFDNEPPW